MQQQPQQQQQPPPPLITVSGTITRTHTGDVLAFTVSRPLCPFVWSSGASVGDASTCPYENGAGGAARDEHERHYVHLCTVAQRPCGVRRPLHVATRLHYGVQQMVQKNFKLSFKLKEEQLDAGSVDAFITELPLYGGQVQLLAPAGGAGSMGAPGVAGTAQQAPPPHATAPAHMPVHAQPLANGGAGMMQPPQPQPQQQQQPGFVQHEGGIPPPLLAMQLQLAQQQAQQLAQQQAQQQQAQQQMQQQMQQQAQQFIQQGVPPPGVPPAAYQHYPQAGVPAQPSSLPPDVCPLGWFCPRDGQCAKVHPLPPCPHDKCPEPTNPAHQRQFSHLCPGHGPNPARAHFEMFVHADSMPGCARVFRISPQQEAELIQRLKNDLQVTLASAHAAVDRAAQAEERLARLEEAVGLVRER